MTVDEHRRDAGLGINLRQAESTDEGFLVVSLDFVAECQKSVAGHLPSVRVARFAEPSRSESHIAAERNEAGGIREIEIAADVVNDPGDLSRQQADPLLVGTMPRREPLAQSNRSQGVDARLRRLSVLEAREIHAAAADF